MRTHCFVHDVLHLDVGVVPEISALWHADITKAECEQERIGGVCFFCGINQMSFHLVAGTTN